MKASGQVIGNRYLCAVYTSERGGPIGSGWEVGDVIPVIYGLDDIPDEPGPWIVRRVWYEDGAWRMEAERYERWPVQENNTPHTPDEPPLRLNPYKWGRVGTCSQCGKVRPVRWTPDPFDFEVNPEDDPQPDWWCEECWHERHDDV